MRRTLWLGPVIYLCFSAIDPGKPSLSPGETNARQVLYIQRLTATMAVSISRNHREQDPNSILAAPRHAPASQSVYSPHHIHYKPTVFQIKSLIYDSRVTVVWVSVGHQPRERGSDYCFWTAGGHGPTAFNAAFLFRPPKSPTRGVA
jgi:hypothetical protein